MQDRIRGDACRTTMICVDSYERGVPAGRFYSFGQNEDGTAFYGLTQLLTEMESILDSANVPQSFTAKRSFANMPEPREDSSMEEKFRKGALANFSVKVLFRQHSSWQGTITWLDKQYELPFRSVLELILLMGSALGGTTQNGS